MYTELICYLNWISFCLYVKQFLPIVCAPYEGLSRPAYLFADFFVQFSWICTYCLQPTVNFDMYHWYLESMFELKPYVAWDFGWLQDVQNYAGFFQLCSKLVCQLILTCVNWAINIFVVCIGEDKLHLLLYDLLVWNLKSCAKCSLDNQKLLVAVMEDSVNTLIR